MHHRITTIDTGYMGPRRAAAFLIQDGDRAAFVEANTALAVPRLLATLDAAGLAPEQVDLVAVTHVHLDHAGGAAALLAACPNATLLAHPRAARHLIDPSRLVASAIAVYGAEPFAALYGTIKPVDPARVRAMEDGATASLGASTLTFVHTRGHANHHAVIHDDRAAAVFTGDAFGLAYPDLQTGGRFVFPSTSPTDFDPDAAHRSVDRILALAPERVFLTHYGEYHDLETMAHALHRQLDAYATLLADAASPSLPDLDIDALTTDRVAAIFDAELRAHDLDSPETRALLDVDITLNAQGVAFVARRLRATP